MRPPFYRACRKHREELEDRTEGTGHEILWCERGKHRCRSWRVMDGNGDTLAIGFLNEAPHLISSDLAKLEFPPPPPPEKFCGRGHFEWNLETDGRYRCRICKRDRALKLHYTKNATKRIAALEKVAEKRKKNDHTGQVRITVKCRSGFIHKWVEKVNKKLRKEQRCQRPAR
jgi:hypothetical protein